MKFTYYITLVLIFCMNSQVANSQAIIKKDSKESKKESIKLTKEGWKTTKGSLSIDIQLCRYWAIQAEQNKSKTPTYLISEAESIAEYYDIARMQALETAKTDLITQIESNITKKSNITSCQLSEEESATISNIISTSKSITTIRIGTIMPIMEISKTLKDNQIKVVVKIAYDAETAEYIAKVVIKEQLKYASTKLQEQISKILNLE